MTRHRRDFLSSASLVAVLGVSGCSGTLDDSTGTGSPSGTETTLEGTETETTPTAAPPLSEAREKVETAEEIYLSWSGQQRHGYFGVTVESMPRDFEKLDRLLGEAREQYRQYRDGHPEKGGIQVQLNWARTLHDWARIQFEAIHALWALRGVRRGVFTQDFAGSEAEAETFEGRISTASSILKDHKRWWDEERSGHLADVSKSVYDAKVLQLELAVHSMSFLKESLLNYAPVSLAFADVLSKYVDDPVSVERNAFEDLLGDLSGIETDLREFCCATDDVGDFIEWFRESVTAAKDGTEQLQKAATAAREGDTDDRRKFEKRARDAFTDSEFLVPDDSEVAGLVEQLTG